MFTFNDCDTAHGVALAEDSDMSYTPARKIKEHVGLLGFEILPNYESDRDVFCMLLMLVFF